MRGFYRNIKHLLCAIFVFCTVAFSSNFANAEYICDSKIIYDSCESGYYMTYSGSYNGTAKVGNACTACPSGWTCSGGTSAPTRTITLNKNGGSGTINGTSGTTSATKTCTYGSLCSFGSASGLTQTGYKFTGGWGTSSSCTAITTSFTNPSSSTYYACKTAQPVYAITLDSKYYATSSTTTGTDVTTNAAPTPIYVKYNTDWYTNSSTTKYFVNLSTLPQKSGYTFGGFYTGKAGTGYQIIDASGKIVKGYTTAFTKHTTLYAKWTPICNKITIVDDGINTGATIGYLYKQTGLSTYYSDSSCSTKITSITVPVASKALFTGLYTDKLGDDVVQCANSNGVLSTSASCNISGETTWYAVFECMPGYVQMAEDMISYYCDPNNFVISYNANGGTGTMSNQSFTYDVAKNLLANTFTRTGYVFTGWNTAADGSGTSYADKESVKNLATGGIVTLYAQWAIISVKCAAGTYLKAGGTTTSDCVKCPKATTYSGAYCPGGTFNYNASSNQGLNACPVLNDSTRMQSSSYPNNDDGGAATMISSNISAWYEGQDDISDCLVTYTFSNSAGNFTLEAAHYSSSTGRYDNGGGKYYTTLKPGYYLTTKYSDTYCDTSAPNYASRKKLYRTAYKCPADSYCPGYASAMPLCSSTAETYGTTMGKFACPDGYTYNTTSGKTSASACQIQCPAGTMIETLYGKCTTPSGGWWASGSRIASYGNFVPVNYCMDGYTNSGTATTNHDAQSDCTKSVSGASVATTIPARYIRLKTAGNTVNDYTNVVEIQAFASSNGTGTNLLSGKGSTDNLKKATDGTFTQSVYANTVGNAYLTWDMGSKQDIGSIKFAMYSADARTYKNVQIEVSADGSNWTTVLGPRNIHTPKANATDANPELLVLAGQTECSEGTYAQSTPVSLGSTKSCSTCPTNSSSTAGATLCTCNTGYSSNGGAPTTTTEACVANTYTVSYKCFGPPFMSGSLATYNNSFTLSVPSSCVKAGYTLTGWTTTDDDGNTIEYGPTDTFVWKYLADKTFNAVWTPICYPLEVDVADGADKQTYHTLYQRADDLYSLYSTDNCEDGTNVNMDEYMGSMPNAKEVPVGFYDVLTNELCVDENLEFTGNCVVGEGSAWMTKYQCKDGYWSYEYDEQFSYPGASCDPLYYKITLDMNGGNANGAPGQIYEKPNDGWYDEDLTQTIDNIGSLPIKDKYVFNGFFTEQNGTGTQVIASDGRIIAPNFLFNSDATIYAYYTKCECTPGDGVSVCSIMGTPSENRCLINVTCESGYSDDGNDTDNGGRVEYVAYDGKPGVAEYTATCKKIGAQTGYVCPVDTVQQYISCYTGNYMATMDASGNYVYNGTPTSGNSCEPCPADAAYCPGGTSAPLYGVAFSDDIEESMVGNTLYANVNGEYYGYHEEEYARLERLPDENYPVKHTGLTFNGYWTQSQGGEQYIDANGNFLKGPSESIMLYAQWTQCPAGTYEQDGVCVTCPKGSYCANGIKNSCSEGTYADKEGMSECTACPSNSSSEAGATECTCNDGYMMVEGTCVEPEFTITTTNMAAESTFSFEISAKGTFYVDFDDGRGVQKIDRTNNTTNTPYTSAAYANAGTHTIKMYGDATGYAGTDAAISFRGNTNIVTLGGSLGAIFGGSAMSMFANTFNGCTSLQSIPETLFSGVTGSAIAMFANTFRGCTSLQSIPETLFSGVTGSAMYMFDSTFRGCTSLQSIPETLFSGVTGSANYMFEFTFSGCTSLQSIPDTLFSGVTGSANYMFYSTFFGCTSLQSIPETLFSGVTGSADSMFSSTFSGCTSLQSIPETLFSGVTGSADSMFSSTFFGCTSLQSIPETLFSGVTGSANFMFYFTFYGCTSLTSLPNGLFKNIEGKPLSNMFVSTFSNCSKLTGYIPANTFEKMDSTDFNSATMSGIFTNTALDTQCPAGMYQYITGFESAWSRKVSCVPCPSNSNSEAGATECTCNTGYNHNGGTTTTTNACVTNQYTVTFNANGGTGSMANQTFTYGEPQNLTANAFTRTGYTFNGWNTAENGGGTAYADSASVENLTNENGATVTLYAQWSQCPAGTYSVNGTCVTCPAGTYSANGTCVTCPKGSYCVNGIKNSCSEGTYADEEGMTECTACPVATNQYGSALFYVTSSKVTEGYDILDSIDTCAAMYYYMPEYMVEMLGITVQDAIDGFGYDPNTDANKRGIQMVACSYNSATDTYTTNCDGYAQLCTGGYYSPKLPANVDPENFVEELIFQTDTLDEFLDQACVPVGVGYWSPDGKGIDFENIDEQEMIALLQRHACPTGLTTIGYGAGADEAGDCGRVLHVDGEKLYLRSTEKTDVSLHVKVDGVTFFGNMVVGDRKISAGADKTLKIKHNGQIYSVYDDSVN